MAELRHPIRGNVFLAHSFASDFVNSISSSLHCYAGSLRGCRSAAGVFNIPSDIIFLKPVSLCIIYAAHIKLLFRFARGNAQGSSGLL